MNQLFGLQHRGVSEHKGLSTGGQEQILMPHYPRDSGFVLLLIDRSPSGVLRF